MYIRASVRYYKYTRTYVAGNNIGNAYNIGTYQYTLFRSIDRKMEMRDEGEY